MKKVVYPSKYIKAYQDDYRYEWVQIGGPAELSDDGNTLIWRGKKYEFDVDLSTPSLTMAYEYAEDEDMPDIWVVQDDGSRESFENPFYVDMDLYIWKQKKVPISDIDSSKSIKKDKRYVKSSTESNYVKLNDEPIEIEYVESDDEEYDFQPSFEFYGKRYYLQDFMRADSDFIDGYDAFGGLDPICIKLIGDSAVDVYETKKDSYIGMSEEIDSSIGFFAKKAALKYMMDEYGMTKEEAKAKMKDMTDDEIRDYADVQTILIDKNPRKAYSY